MKLTLFNLSLTACAFGVMSKTLVCNQIHEVLEISFKSFIVLDLAFRTFNISCEEGIQIHSVACRYQLSQHYLLKKTLPVEMSWNPYQKSIN